ncbi:MAG: winged helix-turn-helix domain-containing protein [Methylococcales bacterium]|nr:winged helix-turn-helix domain-containing protein [Methylococcales bacterium]
MNGLLISLTATEFAMLQLFVRSPQRVFSRDSIMTGAYNNIYISDQPHPPEIRRRGL